MKYYLASPLFTDYERKEVQRVAELFRALKHEVYVPMEHTIENAWDYTNYEWARQVFNEDVKAIQECDAVICLYYGLYSDSGTAWECGFAYGINKPVYLYDKTNGETSLMVVNGAANRARFKNSKQT